MKKFKKRVALMLSCIMFLCSFQGIAEASEGIPYDEVIKAYKQGEQMEAWVVDFRKQAAEELGLSEHLDERAFLSIDYRNQNKIGRDGEIVDPRLNILVEMATAEEEEMILMAGQIQTFAESRAITAGTTVSVTQKARVSGAGNGYFTISGAGSYGYCAQNSKDFWSNEQVKTGKAVEWNNATARKVLYYGPGGPGYKGPYYGSLGADMDYCTYAVGKLNGDTNNNTKATTYINKVSGYTDPINYGYKAYKADIAEPYQDIAFLAKIPNVTVTLTKVDSETGAKLTGAEFELWGWNNDANAYAGYGLFIGKFTDNGNGTYSITFPYNKATLKGSTYYYLYKEVKAPDGYEIIGSGYSNGFGFTDSSTGNKSFTVTNEPIKESTIQLKKTSANPQITDGNGCYSLAGAEYEVYNDVDCLNKVGTFTTDETGVSNILSLDAGTYYVKETLAPKGFALDPEVYEVVLAEGENEILEVEDLPQLDPVGVLLGKVDKETNQNKPQGSASLEGAQFTVKYYDVLLADKAADPAKNGFDPVRTWVFETDEDGFCYYDKDWLVSGEDLYLAPTGYPSLPIGTITIQETKAPEGYHINPEVFVRQISPEGSAEWVNTYNQPVIPETILKLELTKKQEGTDNPIAGAVFEHTLPNGTKETLTSNADGKIYIKGLVRGVHSIQEISAPSGYMVNEHTVTFTVEDDNSITLNSDSTSFSGSIIFNTTAEGNVDMTVYDKLGLFSIIVHKENNEGLKLPGAEFSLYKDKECKNEVANGSTDDSGILKFANLKIGEKYYLREERAPLGYRPILDESGNPAVTEIYTTAGASGKISFCIDGKEYTDKSADGFFTLTGSGENIEVNVKVINNINLKLPDTGSNWMLPILTLGFGLMLMSYALKREEDNLLI